MESGLCLERPGLDGGARQQKQVGSAHSDLRAAFGLVAAGTRRRKSSPHLPRTCPSLGRLFATDGFHARGISAYYGASILRILGVSDYGVLRPDESLRN